MSLSKEELLKEYFKVHGVAEPIVIKAHEQNPAIFEWFYKKLSDAHQAEQLRREEVKVLMREVLEKDKQLSEAKEEVRGLRNVYNALDKAHLTASEQIQELRSENARLTDLYS